MAVEWTLEYLDGVNPGVEKSLADWGVDGPSIDFVSQDMDRLTLPMPAKEVDDAAPWAFESTVKLKRDGVVWFVGVVMEPALVGTAESEGWTYEALGPWYWLEHREHKTPWQTYDPGTEQIVTKFKSHVFLGVNNQGQRLTIKGTIKELLDRLIGLGVPIQYDDSTFPDILFPVMEHNDITVADAIRDLLKYVPDAVTQWDYSTDPPTLKILRRADMSPVTLDKDAEDYAIQLPSLKARRDHQRTEVVINYGKTHRNGTLVQNTLEVDKWPANATGDAHRGVNLNIELAGGVITYVSSEVLTDTIEAASTDQTAQENWWKKKQPWLASDDIQAFSILSVGRQSSLARELIDGNLADWMLDGQGQPVQYVDETITARVRFTNADGTIGEKDITEDITATNAVSQVYSTWETATAEEVTPVGLAQAYYDAVNALQYEGQIVIDEDEVSGLAGLGNLVNVLGGRTEWETMATPVVRVTQDLESGITRLRVGPADHLGIPDLVTLLQVTHNRLTWTNSKAISTAVSGTRQQVEIPKRQRRDKSTGGVERMERTVVATKTSEVGGQGVVRIDPVLLPVVGGKRLEMQIRPMDVCIENSDGTTSTGKIKVLATDVYDLQ